MASAHDWIDYTSAIGTAAAAVIALGFGVIQFIREHRMRAESAELAAHGISDGLSRCLRSIENAHALADGWLSEIPHPEAMVAMNKVHAELIAAARFSVSEEQLHALIPIPNQCAMQIAAALGALKVLEVEVNGELNRVSRSLFGTNFRSQPHIIIEDWHARLARINGGLAGALKEIKSKTPLAPM